MGIFIKGIGIISPQKNFDSIFFENEIVPLSGSRMQCIEPDYSLFIDTKQIRRMSRVIKMGVASSMLAMKDAGIEKPDAVIAGTALGCLEDTGVFLKKMIQNKEEMLNPTPFIYSTHNTIASQIALTFGCKGYNSTYVHRNISFESALLDAMLLLQEGACENVLAGGIDELTDASFKILSRLGHFKKAEELSSGNLYSRTGAGTIAGEGSAFFALVNKKDDSCYAEINSVRTISFAAEGEVSAKAKALLHDNGIEKADILISGHNGDSADDKLFDSVAADLNMSGSVIKFKHLCGEFGTASGFSLAMAAYLLKNRNAAKGFGGNYSSLKNLKTILIHNQNKNVHHSLILVSAC